MSKFIVRQLPLTLEGLCLEYINIRDFEISKFVQYVKEAESIPVPVMEVFDESDNTFKGIKRKQQLKDEFNLKVINRQGKIDRANVEVNSALTQLDKIEKAIVKTMSMHEISIIQDVFNDVNIVNLEYKFELIGDKLKVDCID